MKKLFLMLFLVVGGVLSAGADTWTLSGDFNSWSNTNEFDSDGKVTVSFTVGQIVEFKLVKNGSDWYGYSDAHVTYSNNSNLSFTTGGGNCYMIAGEAGSYTFNIDVSDSNPKLSITYPEYTGKIYFCNNLGWENPYVYILTTSYWDGEKGSGSNGRPDGLAMSQIGSTNIWQASCPASIDAAEFYVAFLEGSQNSFNNFWDTKAVYRGDFKSISPVFVPNTTKSDTKNTTEYYNNGEWHAYPTYTRNVTSGNFGTICLPFNATVEGAKVYQIESKTVDGGSNVTGINLVTVDALEAGKAYIYKATASTLTANYTGSYAEATEANGMLGNLSSGSITAPEGSFVVSGNQIHEVVAGDGVKVGQYKAYITLTGILPAGAGARADLFLGFDDETTGIETVKEGTVDNAVFNLQGQRVMNAQKGLYIVNGKKMLMK